MSPLIYSRYFQTSPVVQLLHPKLFLLARHVAFLTTGHFAPRSKNQSLIERNIRPLKVGIIGAAIAGPVLALQLLSHPLLGARYTPVVYDRGPDPLSSIGNGKESQSGGAAVAVFANGLHPLKQLGLLEAVQEAGQRTPNSSFWRVNQRFSKHGYDFLGTMKHTGWAEDLQSHLVAIERKDLQAILLRRLLELGAATHWNKSLDSITPLLNCRSQINFSDSSSEDVDLVVGADGAFSAVRKHILQKINPQTAEEKWMPSSFNASTVYGITSRVDRNTETDTDVQDAYSHTHGVWFPHGNLSTSPLPHGKMRWDLQVSDERNTDLNSTQISDVNAKEAGVEAQWTTRIAPGVHSSATTIEILRKHADIYHPVTGTFGNLVTASERIIHSPLRQRVWSVNEIQHGNIALIGDASRALLPSSGQGTSLAIEDATVLANALLNHKPDDRSNLNAALKEYASLRVPRSTKVGQMAWVSGKIGLGETWYWRWLRDLSSWAATFSSPKSHDSWPFKDRYEVRKRSEADVTS